MKEFDKMTDEELNAVVEGAKAEIKKRQSAKKKEYNDRYLALNEIAKAFKNYYDKFGKELPYMWVQGVHNKPAQYSMVVSHDEASKHPYLYFYRR